MLKKTNKVTRLHLVETTLAKLVAATRQIIIHNYAVCPCCHEGTYPQELVGTGAECHEPFCPLVEAREVISK